MESWRFLVAVVLMIAVVLVTNLLVPPPPAPDVTDSPPDTTLVAPPAGEPEAPPSRGEPAAPPRAAQDTLAPREPEAGAEAPVEATVEAPAEPSAEPPRAAGAEPVDTILVESPLYRLGFSTRGAGLVAAELLRFESFAADEPRPVQLVPEDLGPLLAFDLRVGSERIDLSEAHFQPSARAITLAAGREREVLTLRHEDPGGGFAVVVELEFDPGSYTVGVRGRVEGLTDNPVLVIGMGPTLGVNEANAEEDFRALSYVVNGRREGIRNVRLDKVDSERIEEGPLIWAALRNKYFVVALHPPSAESERYFGGLIARPLPLEHAAELAVTLPVQRDGGFAYRMYLGPQEAERLAALGNEFADVNPIGYRIFRPIIRPLAHVLTWALVQLQRLLDIGYGWVLILFGFIIRGALWPLNAKAMRAQLKNMEVQPLLQEVQKKHKNDPQKLQQEMVRLYKEEGFNPLGGCLPMLFPMPVLITLFFVFQNTIEFRGVEFLWLPDLSRPDPLYILPVLLGVSMFVLQFMSLRSTPQANPQMKMMMWFMPIFMVVIFLNLASGLNLYYAASNVATVPQQMILLRERRRIQARRKPREQEEEEKPAPPTGTRAERRRKQRGAS